MLRCPRNKPNKLVLMFKSNVFAALLAAVTLSNSAALASAEDVRRASQLFLLSGKNMTHPSTRDVALRQINEAIRLDPRKGDYYLHKARILAISEDEDEEALRCLDKFISVDPTYADSWNMKAQILLRNKKPELALVCADKAIKYGQYPSRLTRMKILQRLERFSEALKEADEFLQKYPNNLLVLAIHADLSQKLEHWQAVIEDQTKLLKFAHPGASFMSHLKSRAKAYIETHQDDKALLDLEEAAKRTSLDRQVHTDMLAIYKRKKDLKNVAKQEAYIKKMDEELSP